jgi:protein-L-isoaspartate O-methyltransferase
MLKPEEIILAYNLFLGRNPESLEVINNLAQTTHTVEQLRHVFIESPEFRQRIALILDKPQAIRQRHPLTFPSIPVDVKINNNQLAYMFERIHKEWEELGERDPFWSVVTQPHYHLDQFDAHKEQFYSSGNYISEIFLAALRRNNINYNNMSSCLEIGCGVGRVTSFLAEAFPKVIATDISSSHLELARKYLEEQNVTNVDLQHFSDTYALESLPKVDSILSVITLQHNPPPVIAWMLGKLLVALNPSGVAYLQIPTYRSGYLFEVDRYLQSEAPKTLEMHFLPQHEIFRIVAESDCICLEIREDGMVGDEDMMLSNTFLIQKRSNT